MALSEKEQESHVHLEEDQEYQEKIRVVCSKSPPNRGGTLEEKNQSQAQKPAVKKTSPEHEHMPCQKKINNMKKKHARCLLQEENQEDEDKARAVSRKLPQKKKTP